MELPFRISYTVGADKEIEAWEKARIAQEKQSRFEKCGIGERYFSSSFSTFQTKTQKQQEMKGKGERYAQAIIKGGHGNFILCGTAGTGKTLLGACIIRAVQDSENNTQGYKERFNVCNYYHAQYAKITEIINAISAAKSFTSKTSVETRIREYADYDLLVIDEIGTGGKDETSVLFDIIDRRNSRKKPTMFISNLNWQELQNHCGARILSRLKANIMFFDTGGIADQRPTFEKT